MRLFSFTVVCFMPGQAEFSLSFGIRRRLLTDDSGYIYVRMYIVRLFCMESCKSRGKSNCRCHKKWQQEEEEEEKPGTESTNEYKIKFVLLSKRGKPKDLARVFKLESILFKFNFCPRHLIADATCQGHSHGVTTYIGWSWNSPRMEGMLSSNPTFRP